MKTFKYHISLLSIALAIPLFSFAQTQTMKNYKSEKENAPISVSDSIFKIREQLNVETTKYKSLEEATMDVNRLLELLIDENIEGQKLNSESLAFRIAQRNKKNREKEQLAKDAWTNTLEKDTATVKDFTALYERFGNKPTYYINGTEVDESLLNKVRDAEIKTKNIKVTNTFSGNPNGEVWYEITSKAAQRIKLYSAVEYDSDDHLEITITDPEGETYIEKKGEVMEAPIQKKDQEKDTSTAKPKQNKIAKEEKENSKRSVRKVKANIKNKK